MGLNVLQTCCKRSSNRTFMELKWNTRPHSIFALLGSNRTFMELK